MPTGETVLKLGDLFEVFVCLYMEILSISSPKNRALSSTESEIVELCDATTEALCTYRLLFELNEKVNKNNCTILENNQNCLKFIKGNCNMKHNKRIDIKYRFIR